MNNFDFNKRKMYIKWIDITCMYTCKYKNLISSVSYCHHKSKYSSSIVWTILGLLWHNIYNMHLEHLVVVTKSIQTCKILNHIYIHWTTNLPTKRIPYPPSWFFENNKQVDSEWNIFFVVLLPALTLQTKTTLQKSKVEFS